ncbi:MAG: metal-binding protein [Hydrogenothermaceae bacterium]|nr:metal-binding protein [Hydrogenothermaceae bacterium]
MASGRTHDLVNLLAFPPIVYYLQPTEFFAFTSGYMVGTFFLTPDNDIIQSNPNKRWKLLRFIWIPYTKIFSHRGMSHIPFYGIFLKLSYLAVVFLSIAILVSFLLESTLDIEVLKLNLNFMELIKHPLFLSFLIGLLLSEIMHIFTDIVYSILKPKRKRKKKR